MYWDTFPGKPKEAESKAMCYESRRCQVNGPFSFLFFPNFTLSTFSVSWKFSCYAILFPVATRLEAPSWYHFNCLEDGRDAGLITIRVAQSVSFGGSNVGCLRIGDSASLCMLVKIPLPKFKFVSKLDVTKGKNKIFVL